MIAYLKSFVMAAGDVIFEMPLGDCIAHVGKLSPSGMLIPIMMEMILSRMDYTT
jgi:hypothetical protein